MPFLKEHKRIVTRLLVLGILGISLVGSPRIWAQVSGAMLSGTVTDASSAIVPGAQISIKNVGTGESRAVVADGAGLYTAPNLLPGNYEVSVTAPGFSTSVQSGIVLTVGAQQVLNITLQVGQTSQQIQVTAEAPAVELASSEISNEVTAETVRELPLNGRDWTLLAALQPGIANMGSQQQAISSSYVRGDRGYGTEMSISGGRPSQNNYRIDGISVMDYANGGPGSSLGLTLGVDAIQEFSVISSNYSAEYGRTSGGVINAITRTGTNGFHGDVYEFLRNSALDAATYVDNEGGIPKPAFRQNQFGAAAGGPIQKDRTFFFATYEGIRQTLGATHLDIVPSLTARQGIIYNANGTSCTIGVVSPGCNLKNSAGTVGVDPAVQPYLGFWPLPNGPILAPGNTADYSVAGAQTADENFGNGRVDHKFSEKDSLFGTYQTDRALLTAPDALNYTIVGNNTTRQTIALEETHILSPQLINNARFGFNRVSDHDGEGVGALNPLATNTALSVVPGENPPGIGPGSGVTGTVGGPNAGGNFFYTWNDFQGYDDAFLTTGKHALKFGFSAERMQLNVIGHSQPAGTYSFSSLTNFLENGGGVGDNLTVDIPGGNKCMCGFRQSIFGGYAQDDLHLRSNLTINMGLRYEMSTVDHSLGGKMGNMEPITAPLPTCSVAQPGCAPTPGPLYQNPTLRNFEPRVGFAWDPFHTGKTSVRGGFGMFDVLPLNYEWVINTDESIPGFEGASIKSFASGAFPSGAVTAAEAKPALRAISIQNNPKRNYVMQWNLNVQRELLPNLTMTLGYVGSRGVHMPYTSKDTNMVQPTLTPQGYMWPCPGGFTAAGVCTAPGTGTVLNPAVGRMDGILWDNNSFYDDLELGITKRMSHGLRIQGSYTWSKSIDEGSSSISATFANSIPAPFIFAPSLFRAVSDYNVPQKLVINYTWDIPSPQSLHGPAALAVRGWEMGGVFTVQSGLPFTPGMSGDVLGELSSMTVDFPNRLTGPGCQTGVNPGNYHAYIDLQCFAFPNPSTLLGNAKRNSLIGPGMENVDFSLFKNNYITKISEVFNVQFRAEFYNVLNRANFAAPTDRAALFGTTGAPVAGAGVLDILATPAREIQFALKVIW